MKRYEINGVGIKTPLQLVNVDKPKAQKGEVLIKTMAFSINPVDIKTRQGGGLFGRLKAESPIVLGWDIAGEVVGLGEGANKFKIGDRVFGMVNFPGHGKAYAEYVSALEDELAIIPQNIDYQMAAATTLAALTALQVLARHIKPNDKVFIQAAAGGVGHFAVQIAKLMGTYVIGTGSQKNEAYLKDIGLDQFVDYRNESFEEVITDVDFALDCMGDEILKRTVSIVKQGGKIISIPTIVSPDIREKAIEKNITVDFELVNSSGADMDQLANWLSKGELTPFIYNSYSFDEIEEAHKQIISGSTKGKLVVVL